MNILKSTGINFILILISIIFSYIFFNDQVALRPALVLSGIIDYDGSASPLRYYFFNSWTLLTQFAALLLKIGLDVKQISYFLVFILTTIICYSCFLILKKFTNDKYLSLAITVFLIFFQKNLGDTDYPSLIFTIHTYGSYAQALTGLIIASLLFNSLRFSITLSFILLAIHPLVGIWVLTILFFLILWLKHVNNFNEFLKIALPGTIITLISLIFFFYLSIDKIPYDNSLFENYVKKWDGHRATIDKEYHYEYIFKSLVFIILLNYLFPKKNYNKLFLYFLNILVISSILIYVSFKILDLNNFEVFSAIIPGRFMIIYTFIAWPILLSLIYCKFKDKFFIKYLFIFLIITYSIMHYKNFINIKDNLVEKNIFNKFDGQNEIFLELRNLNDSKNVIATANSSFNVLYLSNKPLLLTDTIDFLPYHPYLVNSVKDIMTDVYGYDFFNPPKLNYPYLDDEFIKKVFEKRTIDEWKDVAKKFNSNVVIAPKNWNLNIKSYFKGKKYNLYRIN